MNIRKRLLQGQAALEYMLLLTVVAVVIFIAIKPSSNPSALNRAQNETEAYYNTMTEVIMGKNPRPIDGGWCAPKPNGERECACPQPAFGGAPCVQASTIQYCGDGICNNGETGQPGHPANANDNLITCFEDCNYAPNCDQCSDYVPAATCGTACPTVNCPGVEVCMSSNCAPSCPNFRQFCQEDATYCSGGCFCNPGTWTPLAGCGETVGTCTPTWLEKCFRNNDCNDSCTAAQRIQPRRDAECGKCAEKPEAIACGPGTISLPETNNGEIGSVACPEGCRPGNLTAKCVDGQFSSPSTICLSTFCDPLGVSDPDCGSTTLPGTDHGNISRILCPGGCPGEFSGTCNAGEFQGVGDTCVPAPCTDTNRSTIYCGTIPFSGVNNGQTSTTTQCGPGCTGSYSARCSNGRFINVDDQCRRNCPAGTLPTTACGNVPLSETVHGATSAQAPCPTGCVGTATAQCNNGQFFDLSDGCTPAPCTNRDMSTAYCGLVSVGGVSSGSDSPASCPSGCSGTFSAQCSYGQFVSVNDQCRRDCPTQSMPTAICGSVDLPPTQHGQTISPTNCPSGCIGTVSAQCDNGSFVGFNDSGCAPAMCQPGSLTTAYCGPVDVNIGAHGEDQPLSCPSGCTGSLNAHCNRGSFSLTTDTCMRSCSGRTENSGICGDVQISAAVHGAPGTGGCRSGCDGSLSMTCNNGTFENLTGSCQPKSCLAFNHDTGACGSVPISAAAHGASGSGTCPPNCTGSLSATCDFGNFGSVSGSCTPKGCSGYTYDTQGCGTVNIRDMASGESIPIACPNGCDGQLTASCSFGGATVSGSCTPRTCAGYSQNTGACGFVPIPPMSSGQSVSPVPCPNGCDGQLIPSCNNGTPSVSGVCSPRSCSGYTFTVTGCGTVNVPPMSSGQPGTSIPCPGTCTGGPLVPSCTLGTPTMTGNCTPAPTTCDPLFLNMFIRCGGNITLPRTNAGQTVRIDTCPPGCTGYVQATCQGPTWNMSAPNGIYCMKKCQPQFITDPTCGTEFFPGANSGQTYHANCGPRCRGTGSTLSCFDGVSTYITRDCRAGLGNVGN